MFSTVDIEELADITKKASSNAFQQYS